MIKITFEDRAVAFIEVLGFSAMVNKASRDTKAMDQLQSLVNLLASAVPALDKGVDKSVLSRLIPSHTYISDSIILSAPLSDSAVKYYNGLEIIVMRCIQLTHHFLRSGYLLRGGIAVGKTWHGPSNIVGPAYQEAYCLEANGDKPCIMLSDDAVTQWRSGINSSSRMCIKNENIVIVNGLHDFYIPGNTEYGIIEQTYDKYAATADTNIYSKLPQKSKDKWAWFKEHLERERSEAKWPSVA